MSVDGIVGRKLGAARRRIAALRGREGALVVASARDDAAHRLEGERAARERLEAVLESIADGFLALDHAWRLTYVNRAAEFLLQCDRAELLGRDVRELFGEEAHPALFREMRRAAERRDSAELEEFHARLASWLELRVFPSPDGLTLHVRDVTEQKVTQEELKSSEERLRVALQAAGMAYWEWDLRSGIAHWNPDHNHLLGIPLRQERGTLRAFLERVHPDDRDAVARALAVAGESGRGYDTEFRVMGPGGQVRWIAGYGRVLFGTDRRPSRMIGVVRDITARRESEAERERLHAAVEAERARLEAVMEQIPAGVIVAEAPSGAMVAINRIAAEILGPARLPATVEEYGRGYRGFHSDGRPCAPGEFPLARAVRTGETVVDEEMRVRSASGAEWTLRVSAAPVRDAGGGVIAGVLVFHDVTEERRREEGDRFLGRVSDLLASSLDYRTTAQSIASHCAGTLAECCVVHVEVRGTVRALGIAHADPAREPFVRDLLRRLPVDPEGSTPLMRTLLTGEPLLVPRVTDEILRDVTGDPETLEALRGLDLFSALVVPLHARGRILGTVTLARTGNAPGYTPDDLRLAQELARRAALAVDNARLYEEARQAARARDEVLAVVSHDLRNPLHAVLLSATILEDYSDAGEWSDRDLRQVRVIRRAAEQMNGLIHDLVEVVALETGTPTLHRERIAPTTLYAGVAELFQGQGDEKGIVVEVDVEPDLSPVEADRGRLLQVFSNLVGNALKFTPAGGTVTLRAASGEDAVHFSVADTGPGIPEEHLPHVFDRFWRARRGERGGLGLGLAIARGIVEAHGGRIWAESTVGEGSTFHFTLPAAPP